MPEVTSTFPGPLHHAIFFAHTAHGKESLHGGGSKERADASHLLQCGIWFLHADGIAYILGLVQENTTVTRKCNRDTQRNRGDSRRNRPHHAGVYPPSNERVHTALYIAMWHGAALARLALLWFAATVVERGASLCTPAVGTSATASRMRPCTVCPPACTANCQPSHHVPHN